MLVTFGPLGRDLYPFLVPSGSLFFVLGSLSEGLVLVTFHRWEDPISL